MRGDAAHGPSVAPCGATWGDTYITKEVRYMIGELNHPDLLKNPDAIVLSRENVLDKNWEKKTLILPCYRYDKPVPMVLPNGKTHMVQSRLAIICLIDFAKAYYGGHHKQAERWYKKAIRHEANADIVLAFQKLILGPIE